MNENVEACFESNAARDMSQYPQDQEATTKVHLEGTPRRSDAGIADIGHIPQEVAEVLPPRDVAPRQRIAEDTTSSARLAGSAKPLATRVGGTLETGLKTIGLGALLLAIIFFSRAINSTNAEPVPALNDRITLSSVARAVPTRLAEAPAKRAGRQVASQETFIAALSIPELPAVASRPAPLEPRTLNFEPQISAIAGTVIDLDAEKTLWERRPFQRHPLASLTKLMTAVVASEHIGFEKLITVSDTDVLAEGDAGDFKSGEVFAARDLVAAMLLSSSNDAADALARFYGEKPFVDAMQRKAAELGMTNTSFFDPSGLSSLNQSTIDDLAIFARALRTEHPDILALSRIKESTILEQSSRVARAVKSINEFAGAPDFLGGKTGYTPEAHGNLISLFNDGGRALLVIVLGTDDRFGETKLLYDWAKARLTGHP